LLALLGGATIVVVSRLRVNAAEKNMYNKNTAIDRLELKKNMLRVFVYVFFILAM